MIDPLDGTVNFRYGVPLFAVSIAAALDGEVVAGAVIDVLRDELFSAHLGGGARRDGGADRGVRLHVAPDALVTTGFSYQAELRVLQGAVAHRVLARARDIRCFGSAALELCWVACARVDATSSATPRSGTAPPARSSRRRPAHPPSSRVRRTTTSSMAAAPGVFEDLWSVVQFATA